MVDWGNAATGAATGFGLTGSPYGAAAGGLLGLVGGGKSKSAKLKNYNPYNQQQQQSQGGLLSGIDEITPNHLEYLNSIISQDPEAFAQFEAPHIQQFEEDFVPNLIERIMGRGSGSKGSSGLNRALARGASDLSTKLAALKGELTNQAGQTLQNYRTQAMEPQNKPYIQGGSPGLFETAAPYAGQALINRYSNNYR